MKIKIFKLGENGRKFSKWLENTVGKGEIAHYERFKTCIHLLEHAIQKRNSFFSFHGNGNFAPTFPSVLSVDTGTKAGL